MKLTTVAVILTLCLVAVSANAPVEEKNVSFNNDDDSDDVPYDIAEQEVKEFAIFGKLFSAVYKALKVALRTLKGIRCSIDGVLDIQAATLKFPEHINACGAVVTKKLQNLLNAVNTVKNTANDIVTLNDDACQNGNYNEETDAGKKSSKTCFKKMLSKMWTLKKQIQTVIDLSKKIPKVGTDAGVCVQNAINTLQNKFTQFPSMVKNCSKLTH